MKAIPGKTTLVSEFTVISLFIVICSLGKQIMDQLWLAFLASNSQPIILAIRPAVTKQITKA
jgi:hypothetical protein